MAEEEENTTEGGEEGGKKSKKGLIIIIVAVLLLGGGGAGFALMSGGDKKSDEPEVVVYERTTLDTFIVNLSEHNAFLKVKLILEYNPNLIHGGAAGGEGHGGASAIGGGAGGGGGPTGPPGVIGERLPIIRDAIIRVLSSKTSEEVLTPEGKALLKEELVEAINQATDLPEGPIVNVYFEEFIVQ